MVIVKSQFNEDCQAEKDAVTSVIMLVRAEFQNFGRF